MTKQNSGFQSLDLFADLMEPIPPCDYLLDGKNFKHPEDVAREMLREVRTWKSRNPNKNPLNIVAPDWRAYIDQNI